ncbi:MAG: protein serine/threonine phosphatase [Bacteroidetes bacterium]|nr:protein serine/threonine phosphatase [Bacteroidota bacterium]
MFKIKILLLAFLFSLTPAIAGTKVDSLLAITNDPATADTTKLIAYIKIIKLYSKKNVDSAVIFLNKTVELARKTGNKKFEGKAYNFFGIIYNDKGNYSSAIEYYIKALKVWDELHDFTLRSMTNLNMANIFVMQKNYNRALECYDDIIANKSKITMPQIVPAALINSSTIFSARKNWDEALKRAEESLKESKKLGDKGNMGTCYSSMATIAKELKQVDKAVEYHKNAIDIALETKDEQALCTEKGNLAASYIEMKKYKEAEKEATEALEIAREYKMMQLEWYTYQVLAKLYEATGDYEKAYKNFNKHITLKDSMFSQEKAQELVEKEVAYEYGKKEALAKLEQEKKEQLAKAESDRHKLVILGIGLILLIIIFFSFMLARRLRITKQQKIVIEEKNKEITDSINYAKRLQDAILPHKDQMLSVLPGSFIFFRPKDIVAGDFYFFEEEAGTVFVAVADCTGHGVPGAMVSVVCANALTRCVKEFKLKDPAAILDKAREIVLETFRKSGQDVKDGMDISLISLQTSNSELKTIKWSGANNALWYIQNGQLHEIAPDKQPVGQGHNPKPFTSHTVNLNTGDRVYLFSDGYADQFGGGKGKKFRGKALKEMLITIHEKPAEEQERQLHNSFEEWKGKLEQIDDVTVMSFRIP